MEGYSPRRVRDRITAHPGLELERVSEFAKTGIGFEFSAIPFRAGAEVDRVYAIGNAAQGQRVA